MDALPLVTCRKSFSSLTKAVLSHTACDVVLFLEQATLDFMGFLSPDQTSLTWMSYHTLPVASPNSVSCLVRCQTLLFFKDLQYISQRRTVTSLPADILCWLVNIIDLRSFKVMTLTSAAEGKCKSVGYLNMMVSDSIFFISVQPYTYDYFCK